MTLNFGKEKPNVWKLDDVVDEELIDEDDLLDEDDIARPKAANLRGEVSIIRIKILGTLITFKD